MKLTTAMLLIVTLSSATLLSQVSSSERAIVPHLIKFGGKVVDSQGKPLGGIVGVTLSLYKDQTGGAPIWMEVQNVNVDAKGRYVVLLGSTKEDGIPLDLFASGEAQWLGVRAEGQEEQARILLVSVPYALKAADAETLGGKPASAFLQMTPSTGTPSSTTITSNRASRLNIRPRPNIGGSGTLNFIPIWTDNSGTLGNSSIFQNGSNIGFGTTTPAARLSFGNTCCPGTVIHFYDAGAGTRFGAGINGSELQFFFNPAGSGHISFNAAGDLQASGTNEKMRISSTGIKINGGVDATGSGIKHARTNASCTPGSFIGDKCGIVVNWPGTAFPDTNYTATCIPKSISGSCGGCTDYSWSLFIADADKHTASMTVTVENLTVQQALTVNGLNCIAVHD